MQSYVEKMVKKWILVERSKPTELIELGYLFTKEIESWYAYTAQYRAWTGGLSMATVVSMGRSGFEQNKTPRKQIFPFLRDFFSETALFHDSIAC